MISLTGDKQVISALSAYVKKSERGVLDAVATTVVSVEADAIKSIQRGTKTGIVYTRGERKHRASAAGEAPATDTGSFVRTIRSVIKGDTGFVGTNDPRGTWFEFGTMDIAERPWLRPAWLKNTDLFQRLIIKAFE